VCICIPILREKRTLCKYYNFICVCRVSIVRVAIKSLKIGSTQINIIYVYNIIFYTTRRLTRFYSFVFYTLVFPSTYFIISSYILYSSTNISLRICIIIYIYIYKGRKNDAQKIYEAETCNINNIVTSIISKCKNMPIL